MGYMHFENCTPVTNVDLPNVFRNKMVICKSIDLTSAEAAYFDSALRVIAMQMKKENITETDFHTFKVLFSRDYSFTCAWDHPDPYSISQVILVFAMENIRKNVGDNYKKYLPIYIEEFCNYIWRIENSVLAKRKTIEILRTSGNNDIEFDDLIR